MLPRVDASIDPYRKVRSKEPPLTRCAGAPLKGSHTERAT